MEFQKGKVTYSKQTVFLDNPRLVLNKGKKGVFAVQYSLPVDVIQRILFPRTFPSQNLIVKVEDTNLTSHFLTTEFIVLLQVTFRT